MTDQKISQIHIKRGSITETGRFSGYASTYGGEPDEQGDIILPGAFSAALRVHEKAGTQPALLWGHDHSEPVGKWLSFTEDEHGLLAVGQLTLGTKRGAEAYELLKADALSLSIGFSISPGGAETKNGIRYIKDIRRLFEVSLVSIPANPRAKVTAVKSSPREFEKALRDLIGLSHREAKRAAAGGWRALADQSALDTLATKISALKAQLMI